MSLLERWLAGVMFALAMPSTAGEADCLQVPSLEATCGPADNVFNLSLTVQNLSNDVIEHLFFFPPFPSDPNGDATFSPNYVDVPTLVPNAVSGIINTAITLPSAPEPGSQVCFRISLHNQNLQVCCAQTVCFKAPDCGTSTCYGDVNGDGTVNVDDLLAIINTWGTSNPATDIAPPPSGDGIVNVDDLLAIINSWGPCP